MDSVLAILLAGGAGERLNPLTRDTAKPAVPFGGAYRIIDFTLSNCINSDVRRILILTQYKSLGLIRHIRDGWHIFPAELGEYIEVLPPMKRVSEDWYQGTADAVFQNFQSIEAEGPGTTLVLAGDHIYKMNYHEMLDWHRAHNADITIATIQAPPEEAPRFGVMEIDADYRIVGFEEKPQHGNPKRSRFDPSMISASMGIYVFNTEVLLRVSQHALITGAMDAAARIASSFERKEALRVMLSADCPWCCRGAQPCSCRSTQQAPADARCYAARDWATAVRAMPSNSTGSCAEKICTWSP
jgi:glucose-1-phosphate adenylyltransferase